VGGFYVGDVVEPSTVFVVWQGVIGQQKGEALYGPPPFDLSRFQCRPKPICAEGLETRCAPHSEPVVAASMNQLWKRETARALWLWVASSNASALSY
jgi:hypothetical protein